MDRREFVILAVGATGAWGRPARARTKVYRVALLTLEVGEDPSQLTRALRELGYTEGANLKFEHRSANGDAARLAEMAAELVQEKPDVLVGGWGTLAPKALKAATTNIPIVFATVGDPIGAGLIQSLPRPGGNLTGMSGQSADLKSKQLQLLLNCAPGQSVVGVLLNSGTPYAALAMKELRVAAEQQGIRLALLDIRTATDFTAARMDELVASGATSLFIIEDPLSSSLRASVVGEAERLKLPTMTGLIEYGRSGGLMAYGASRSESYRRVADYVSKILKGVNPADLPVEQPTKFQLVVNLKTAKILGVHVPSTILVSADEVIE